MLTRLYKFLTRAKRCTFTWPDWTVCRLEEGHECYHEPVKLDTLNQ